MSIHHWNGWKLLNSQVVRWDLSFSIDFIVVCLYVGKLPSRISIHLKSEEIAACYNPVFKKLTLKYLQINFGNISNIFYTLTESCMLSLKPSADGRWSQELRRTRNLQWKRKRQKAVAALASLEWCLITTISLALDAKVGCALEKQDRAVT